MKGIFHFEVSNKKQFYSFDVKRNITILEGNSATGKTTLLEILQDSKTIEKSIHVRLSQMLIILFI